MRCGADEEEEQVIARFLGVLRADILDMVQLQPYWNFNDVSRLALKIEKQLKVKAKVTTPKPVPSSHPRLHLGLVRLRLHLGTDSAQAKPRHQGVRLTRIPQPQRYLSVINVTA